MGSFAVWRRDSSEEGIRRGRVSLPPGERSENKGPRGILPNPFFRRKERKKREAYMRYNKSLATSDLEGNSWSGMSSIRIRARQARSMVSDIWRECSARSVNEHASRCLLLGKFSRQMPERFRRSRTRYENNERIYVGEEKEKEREERKRELSKRMVEYLLRSSSPPFSLLPSLEQSQIATRVVLSYCRTG